MRAWRVLRLGVLLLAAACHSRSSGDASTDPTSDPDPSTAVTGLEARPSNPTCLAPDRSSLAAAVELTRVFEGLGLVRPLGLLQAPGDGSRWFVLEKGGRVRVFQNDPTVSTFDVDFIDLPLNFPDFRQDGEGGLLGMAFDPDFSANGEVYLSFTEAGAGLVSVLARFTSLDGGLTLDPGSRTDILRINQPFSTHNGGQIGFGPDGLLYAGFGDGGSAGDAAGHAQNTSDLLGAMLRLDVHGAAPYAIPADNPFSANAMCPADHTSPTSCPEIFAWGLRNPWRFSFDSATGALWLGDVGQSAFEEIDRIERNGNYGWNCREGNSGFAGAVESCATVNDFIDPVYDYDRSAGDVSVTGGYAYRGSAIAPLIGDYVFGDFGSGRIWRLVVDGTGGVDAEELLDTTLSISSFGEADDGELYVVDYNGGLYRIDLATGTGIGDPPVPTQLSNTGCFAQDDPSRAESGLVPYAVAAPYWSDGAAKERWLAIPDGTTIDVDVSGDFDFPPGSVLAQHFRLNGDLVETRLFMRHPGDGWAGYSYEWNAERTDATLVVGGKTVDVGGQNWLFPSSNQCLSCHTAAAGFSLGTEVIQLNNEFAYSSTGRTVNQLATLDSIMMFSASLGDPGAYPALPDPFGASGTLGERARAYLHANCAQCHRPGGPTPSDLDLRVSTGLGATMACDRAPQSGELGIVDARIIAPGESARSVLVERMRVRDANAMPPVASNVVDGNGVQLVSDWIDNLTGCQ